MLKSVGIFDEDSAIGSWLPDNVRPVFQEAVNKSLRGMYEVAKTGDVPYPLIDKKTGENIFLDNDDSDGLSSTARKFIQGMMDHSPASMALLAPTINCYTRFKPHTFAPSNVSWGPQDRSAAVRAKNSRDDNTHLENRLGTGLSNPYLAIAAVLATGLLGLEKGTEAKTPKANSGPAEENPNYKTLPTTVEESLGELEKDKAFAGLLGEEFITAYTTMRWNEVARFRSHITDWEKQEYLEIY